ncbi:MAG: L-threonylcarbamoyladenylate synthase [Nanoarchaeota archaeon]
MKIYSATEARLYAQELGKKILDGNLFIHPTDTIYGLGCNALDEKAVNELRITKRQLSRPFSVMVPNKDWIYENCIITPEIESWIEKLPGPYTLILNLKNKKAVANEANLGEKTIGVRLPDHWFIEFLKNAGVPIITTSANITGENFMTSVDELDSMISMKCDFMIDEGVKKGTPSTIVDLSSEKIEIQKRE